MSNNSTCQLGWLFYAFDDWNKYLTYTALPPLFFTLGMVGHLAALLAFAKQSRTESAYGYQVFVTITKTLEIFTFNLFILFMFHFADQNWSGQRGDKGWAWFKSSYALMWFTGHIAPVVQSGFITMPILATAAMACDRAISLSRPVFYQTMNKTKHQTIAFVSCTIIGLLTGLDTAWRWNIIDAVKGDGYKIVATTFGKTTGGVVAGQLRNAVRFVAELVLIACSVVIVALYRKRIKKVATLTTGQSAKKEAEQKAQQTALVVLALFQSGSTMAGTVYLAAYSYASYFLPSFASCQGIIFSTIFDFALQLVNALDFYLLYITSKPFRTVIKKNLR